MQWAVVVGQILVFDRAIELVVDFCTRHQKGTVLGFHHAIVVFKQRRLQRNQLAAVNEIMPPYILDQQAANNHAVI